MGTVASAPWASFLAAAALAGADLGLLALFTRRLGRSSASMGLLAALVALKLGLLALGAVWLSRQPWNDRKAMLAGLIAPFAVFIVWQALGLLLRARRRA